MEEKMEKELVKSITPDHFSNRTGNHRGRVPSPNDLTNASRSRHVVRESSRHARDHPRQLSEI